MPNMDIQLQGQTLSRPGAYYYDNVSADASGPPSVVPPLIFIGNSFGMKPKTPVTMTPQNLLPALRGGPASAFLPFMTNPSGQMNGASEITFINAASNTQALFNLKSTGGSPTTLATLTTVDYGLPSNLMQVSLEAGLVSGSYQVTLFDGYQNITRVGQNVGAPFSVAYLGTSTAVVLSITSTTLTITSPNAGESVSLQLDPSGYATVGAIVAYLNGTGYYLAQVTGDGTLPSTVMDPISSVSLPVGGGTPVYVQTFALLGGLLYWFNQYNGDLVTAAVASGVVAPVTFTTMPLTHFTGGTNVPPALQDYANSLNAALAVPGWVVFIDSNLAAVQALGNQHAMTASAIPNRKWRRFVTGSSVGDTVATTLAAAAALNAYTATYCYPGIQATNTVTGLNQVYGGLTAAAAVAGAMAGNPVAMPLTSKALSGNGCEINLTASQIDELQAGGVMPIANSDAGVPSIISDMTTWQNDSNVENVFNQQVGIRQFMAYLTVQTLAPLVGTISSPFDIGRARSKLIAAWTSAIYSEGNQNGVLSSFDPKSITLTYTGATQTLSVIGQVVPVGQNRFITVENDIQPLNLSA